MLVHLTIEKYFYSDSVLISSSFNSSLKSWGTVPSKIFPGNLKKEEPEENLFGISAHTDYEVFTLLTQSEKGSELKNPEGEWTHVDSDRYEIILMMGDMTEVMTNGLIKPTPHRVPPTKWER